MLMDFPADKKHARDDLHLAVSQRSFRAENLSKFVKEILDVNIGPAKEQLESLKKNYPIRITRNLDKAKEWLRKMARGSERVRAPGFFPGI